MRITKTRTSNGTWGKPVTTELSAVVERMRSEKIRESVNQIATAAQLLRMESNGKETARCLSCADKLPRLVFTATFGRGGWDDIRERTGLLLMEAQLNCSEQQVDELRTRLAQVPYTVLVFRGSSRRTLKVVIRVAFADGHQPKDDAEYLELLQTASRSVASVYESLAGAHMQQQDVTLTSSCRMSQDSQLYFQPQAQAFPVITNKEMKKSAQPEQTADERGDIPWYPTREERNRLQMEYYTCLHRCLKEHGYDPEEEEASVVALAGYCQRAGLEEEACVRRTLWNQEFKLSEDVIRKIFRTTYSHGRRGKKHSQMNEKERIARAIRDFFERRYHLRFNEVKQMVEFRPNDQTFKPWQPLTDRDLKRMAFEEMLEGGEAWLMDMQLYANSSLIKCHNPISDFLERIGTWDQKHDYIEEYAQRLKTDYSRWPYFFHRWMLAMVAQAMNANRDYGNSMVPLLIGPQALKKSTFCKNILPYSMREYYMDDIKLENAEQSERVLSRMWLVNIDEYNAKTEREQAKIKRLLTEKDVQVRRMHSDQYLMTPRLCSFIATTNDPTPLTDPTGSRRYLCVEVNGPADMSGCINYQQMYAQAVWEINHGACYWFTAEDEAEITAHNRLYQTRNTVDDMLSSLFEPAEHLKANFMTTTQIQQELRTRFRACDVPTLAKLGRALRRQQYHDGSLNGVHGYYLRRRPAS